MQTLLQIFAWAFVLNLIWEHLHARLYVHYKKGPITEWILLRASFWDAVIIAALAFFAASLPLHLGRLVMPIAGLVIAILMEQWALATGRWEYKKSMPIVPLLGTGLTPTIQLALLGVISLWMIS